MIFVTINSRHALRHQHLTWTNVDLSSTESKDIHLRAILYEVADIYPYYESQNY